MHQGIRVERLATKISLEIFSTVVGVDPGCANVAEVAWLDHWNRLIYHVCHVSDHCHRQGFSRHV